MFTRNSTSHDLGDSLVSVLDLLQTGTSGNAYYTGSFVRRIKELVARTVQENTQVRY
jgi:hypothetical protein